MSGQKPQGVYDMPAVGWAMAVIAIGILVYLFWFYKHAEVREAVRWIRYTEMLVVSPFLPENYEVQVLFPKKANYKSRDLRDNFKVDTEQYEKRPITFHKALDVVPKYKKVS